VHRTSNISIPVIQMKNTFSRLFRIHQKPIPEIVRNELYRHFPNALNIDWELKKNHYEAIFYLDDVEHIAQISEEGHLAEYKKNLWPEELPEDIIRVSRESGEIMNAIAIFKQGTCIFEVIIRDTNFRRKLLLFDESANLLHFKKL
jgi:hypothetical protein